MSASGFSNKVQKFAESYWIIAIIALKDLYELSLHLYQNGGSLNGLKVDWIDLGIKILLGFAVVIVYRKLRSNIDELKQIKSDYKDQKNRYEKQVYMASLVNMLRLKTVINKTSKYIEEKKFPALQAELEQERAEAYKYLLETRSDLTGEEIEAMMNEFYQLDFL